MKNSVFLDNHTKLQSLLKEGLLCAKKEGAMQVEMGASIEDGYSVTVRMGSVETIEYHCEQSVGITVYMGKRKASITTSSLEKTELENAIKNACSIAKFTQEDDCAGLADANLMAKELRDLDLYHEWSMQPDEAAKLALQCETRARKSDKRIKNSEGVSIANFKSVGAYANSNDFLASTADTCHTISCSLVAEENDSMERDDYYTCARDSHDLESIERVADETARRVLARLNPQKIKTGKVPVIFKSEIARSLIKHFLSAIDGYRLYRKRSFLLDQLGQPIFPDWMQMDERPHEIGGWNSSMFDADGVATSPKYFVQNGVLQHYIVDAYSGRKLQIEPTGNAGGVHNFYISRGDKDLQNLIKHMNKGLLLTELIGQGVNIVTGDYSRGAAGFWVEDGEIQYPVSGITVASNLRDMFANIVAIGNDIDQRSSIKTGSILLDLLTVAGHDKKR